MRRSSKTGPTSTSRRVVILFVLLAVLALNGCARLTPKTEALKKVHDSYRADFQQFIQLSVPQPADGLKGRPQSKGDETAFAETLREIRDYQIKYGGSAPQETAHLKVLEGMIYLQTDQFGMAQLVKADVADAQTKLKSGTGDYARDQLLALAFPDLLTGWDEVNKFATSTTTDAVQNLKDLNTAADNIKGTLDKLDPAKLAKPEVDEGALYLATTAAIFYVWVYQQCSFQTQNPAPPCSAPNTKQQWFSKGQELIGRYLTEMEKRAAQGALQDKVPAGRLRYLSWYGYLSKQQ